MKINHKIKMGSYGISKEEMMEALEKALNGLEGDFPDKQLCEVLDIMKAYPYVSDKKKSEDAYYKLKKLITKS